MANSLNICALLSHWCPQQGTKGWVLSQDPLFAAAGLSSAGHLVQVATESRTGVIQTLGSSCSTNKTGRYCLHASPGDSYSNLTREAGDGNTCWHPTLAHSGWDDGAQPRDRLQPSWTWGLGVSLAGAASSQALLWPGLASGSGSHWARSEKTAWPVPLIR